MTARGQNANDEGIPVDEFDNNSDKNDVHLDRGDFQGDDGDINSSNELDLDQILNPERYKFLVNIPLLFIWLLFFVVNDC